MNSITWSGVLLAFGLSVTALPLRVFGQDARQKYLDNLRTIENAGRSLAGVWEGSIKIGDQELRVTEVQVTLREVCDICKNKVLVASFEFDGEDIKLPLPPHGEMQSAAKSNELKLFLGNEGNSEFCIPAQFLCAWPMSDTSNDDKSLLEIRVFHDLGPLGSLQNRRRKEGNKLEAWGSSLVKVMIEQDKVAGAFRDLSPTVSFELSRKR